MKKSDWFASLVLLFFILITLIKADAASLPSTDRLTFELAHTHKILADEKFLAGDTTEALAQYRQARTELAKIGPVNLEISPGRLALLRDEIAYRAMLIEKGLSFWGAAYSRKPLNPVMLYMRFTNTVGDFGRLVGEVQGLLDRAATQKGTGGGLHRQQIAAQKTATVEALANAQATVTVRFSDRQRRVIRNRLNRITSRQQEIKQKSQSLRQDLADATKQLNSLIVEGVSRAAGIPELSAAAAARDGSLSDVVLAAAGPMLADENSKLAQSMAEFSQTTREAAEYYRRGKEVVDTAERVSVLLRSRSLTNLVEAGAIVYAKLDPASQNQLKQIAATSKSLKTIISLASEGSSLRARVAGFIADQQIDFATHLRPLLEDMVRNRFRDFSILYGRLLDDIAANQPSPLQQEEILDLFAGGWSRLVAEEVLDGNSVTLLLAQLKLDCTTPRQCREVLAAELSRTGLSRLPGIRVQQGKVIVFRGADPSSGEVVAECDLLHFTKLGAQREMDAAQQAVINELDRILERVGAMQDRLTAKIIEMLPDVSFDAHIESLVSAAERGLAHGTGPVAPARVFDAIVGPAATGGSKALAEIASAQIGTLAARESFGTVAAAASTDSAADRRPEEQAMLSALSAAGPYGAAIAIGVQIVGAMNRMDDVADRFDRLHTEDLALSREAVHLEDMVAEAEFSAALADLDQQIAEHRRAAALEIRDHLADAFLETAEAGRRYIRQVGQLMPLVYLKAELLRMYFDALDRQLAIWAGNPEAGSGHIETYFRTNPQWARYALDTDIGLYDWFDRSVEGQREDLTRLNHYWTRLQALATQVCEAYQCLRDTSVIGEVNATEEIFLKTLLPDHEWQRLKAWQAGEGPHEIVIPFLISPATPGAPAHLEGVRVLDVSVAAVAAEDPGAKHALENAQIRHTGVSYIKLGGNYLREAFLPAEKSALRFIPDEAAASRKIDALKNRWGPGGTLSMGELEGYGLFTWWRLVLRRERDTQPGRMADVALRFFYQYRSASPALQDAQRDWEKTAALEYRVRCDGATGEPLEFPIAAMRLLVSPQQIDAAEPQVDSIRFGDRNCKITRSKDAIQ